MATQASDHETTRRLLILLLVKLGATSEEIGLALGVTASAIRKMFPISKIQPLRLERSD